MGVVNAERVCWGDPVCADVDHLLKCGSSELFCLLFLRVYLSFDSFHLHFVSLQISCWDQLSISRIPYFHPFLPPSCQLGGTTNLQENDQPGPTGGRWYLDAGRRAPHPQTEQKGRGEPEMEREVRSATTCACLCVACLEGFTSATGMVTGCISLRVIVSGDTVKSGVRGTTYSWYV